MNTPWSGRTEKLMRRFSDSEHEGIRREMASMMENPENVLNVGCGPNF